MSELSSKFTSPSLKKSFSTDSGSIPIKSWDELLNDNSYSGMSSENWASEIISKNSESELRKSSPGTDPSPAYTGSVNGSFGNYQSFLDLTSGDPGALTALIKENLDSVMTDTLVGEKQLTLLNSIVREPTPSLFSQKVYFNQRGVGYGRGYGSFVEGKTPKLGGFDKVSRRHFLLKQLGVKGSISAMAQNTNMIQSALSFEVKNRMLELLKQLNWQIMFGDSRFNNGLESDGFLSIMNKENPEHVIDLKGRPMLVEHYYYAAELLAKNGNVTDLTGRFNCVQPYNVSLRIASQMHDEKRRSALNSMLGRDMKDNNMVAGIATNMGFLPFLNSPTLEAVEGNKPVQKGEYSAQVPKIHAVLTSTNITLSKTSSTKDNYPKGATSYAYWISASNAYGESLPILCSTSGHLSITATGNQEISITFNTPFGLSDIISWKIYRNEARHADFADVTAANTAVKSDSADARWIATIPHNSSVGASISYKDQNQVIPGTEYVIIKSIDPSDVSIGQLLPVVMRKINDPSQATSETFALFLICALRIWAPERVIIFKNVQGQNYDKYKGIIPFNYKKADTPSVEIEI